jgi:ComF family protein
MVNKALAKLLDGLFPAYCTLCGLRSHRPLPLCRECEHELQPNPASCYRCAIPLAAGSGPETLCGNCLQAPPPFQRVIAPWLYCERLSYLIRRWKFHGERRLTPLLASLWLQQIPQPPALDALVPVPLHWRRLSQRGFNQSELLGRQLRALAPALAGARLDHRGVRRSRQTAAQSGMGAAARAANLRGAFTARKPYDNLRVAIIDDVFTTGATAAAMALALRGAGASHIEVWCLARTPAPDT